MDTSIQLFLATALGGLSGGLVSYLAKTFLSEKIKGSIKSEYDKKLEDLKSELSKNETAITRALESRLKNSEPGQKENVEALKIYWDEYIKVRQALSVISDLDAFMSKNEFNIMFTDKWDGNDLAPNQMQEINISVLQSINQSSVVVEKARPFLNTELWILYTFHKTFTGRIIYLYSQAVKKKRMSHWTSDVTLISMTKDLLSEEEFNYLQKQNNGTIKAVQEFVEQKILSESTKILEGHNAANNTYNQALILIELNKNRKEDKTA